MTEISRLNLYKGLCRKKKKDGAYGTFIISEAKAKAIPLQT
jgi:hypothetical protein